MLPPPMPGSDRPMTIAHLAAGALEKLPLEAAGALEKLPLEAPRVPHFMACTVRPGLSKER